MKNVNLLELAELLSDKEIELVGKRPGEKLNETLISEKELPFTSIVDDYVYIINEKQPKVATLFANSNNLIKEHSSANAEWMSTKEMEKLVYENNI